MSPTSALNIIAAPHTITISEDFDVRYWTKHLDVNELQLQALVQAVGNSVARVGARLRLCRA